MLERNFRILILGSVLAAIVGTVLSVLLESTLPSPLYEYLQSSYEADLTTLDIVLFVLAIPYLAIFIWATVALFQFNRKGRTACLWFTVISFPIYVLLGPVVVTGWEEAFFQLSSVLWGAVLAMAYYSPVSVKFEETASK